MHLYIEIAKLYSNTLIKYLYLSIIIVSKNIKSFFKKVFLQKILHFVVVINYNFKFNISK